MNNFRRFLGRNSAEACLKKIILVVNPPNRQALGAPAPRPLASGSWGFAPRPPLRLYD